MERSEDDFEKNIHLHVLGDSQSEEKRKTFEQTPGCEKNDHNRGKDNHQDVTHTAFRCHLCGKFPVSLCKSCSFNVCKICKVQHPCTPNNANAAQSHDEKGHQRSPKHLNLKDIQKVHSMEDTETMKTHSNYSQSEENGHDREKMCSSKKEKLNMKNDKFKSQEEIKRDLKASNENESHSNESQILCDPCLVGNLNTKATHFCKTCEDPEPLCDNCAQQHIRHKLCRDHEICDAIEEIMIYQDSMRIKKCAENLKTSDGKCPGKPNATEIKSDYVSIFWNKSNVPVNHYQIRFKAKNGNSKWKFTNTDSDENNVNISGLMAYTKYVFQIRGIFGDEEGPYGPANEDIETKQSSATALLDSAVMQSNTNCPPIYLLPVQENKNARNTWARTKQITLGTPMRDFCDEKTIMLVGATGSGKSTLVDGIVNYIMGVSFDDPFRFTMVTLEKEEQKLQNQAISQTEWITVYKIYPTDGSRLSYTLNIIDTPGFGDTRGIERDNAIADQIRHLFSAQGDQGVLYIDAVCFIVKAPDARLTVVQKYIFSSIMSLFGKDIESNICTLITFADGAEPPVLASLKESELPFGLTFNFNNSALFADNKDLTHNTFSPIFWEMGSSSFESFFRHIKQLETKSLSQTKKVLEEREQLKIVISNIRPNVTAGLSKLSELQQQLDIFKRYKNEIKDNQKFEYEVNETRQEKIDLPRGQHVTNCIHCNVTCHENCIIADDEAKRGCWAMDETGNCRICIEKCIWSNHKNTPYIFKYVTETVKKTYAEMKERYEEAQGKKLTHEKYIEELTDDVDELFELIMKMMNEMNACKTRLKEIALRPDPLTAVEHIDLMIQSEELEKQSGFLERVQMLKEMRKSALLDQDVKNLKQNIHVVRENIMYATGRSFQTNISIQKKKKGNPFSRGFHCVKNYFKGTQL